MVILTFYQPLGMTAQIHSLEKPLYMANADEDSPKVFQFSP